MRAFNALQELSSGKAPAAFLCEVSPDRPKVLRDGWDAASLIEGVESLSSSWQRKGGL